MTIKFRKERVENESYEGSLEIRWWFDSGTKYLPKLYCVSECYNWGVYDEEGIRLSRYEYNYSYDEFKSKNDIKKWILNYDKNHEDRLENKKIKSQINEMMRLAEFYSNIKQNTNRIKSFTTLNKANDVKVDDIVHVKMSNISKACSVGESLSSLRKSKEAKVVSVITISNLKYDEFCENSLVNDKIDFHKEDGKYIGGCYSDDPLLDNVDYFDMVSNEKLKTRFIETSKELVNVITSEGRPNLYINTEGYGYARYIGFDYNVKYNSNSSEDLELEK